MSYWCESCQDVVPNNTPCTRVVTKIRPITYFRLVNNRQEIVGKGVEIAKEEKLCADCAATADISTDKAKTTVIKVKSVKVIKQTPAFDEGKESRRKRAAA